MNPQPDFMRLTRLAEFAGGLAVFSGIVGCGGNTTLDLGQSAPVPPWYATPETIAAEDNAPPGLPTEIATHQRSAFAIAVNDDRVFWSTMADRPDYIPGCTVSSCLKSDCAGSLVNYASPECRGMRNQLLITRTHVLWSSDPDSDLSYLFACPIEGCPEKTAAVWARGSSLTFAVDDTHLYWQTRDAIIWRCPLDRCPEGQTRVVLRDSLPSYGTRETAPAVDDANIYWFDTEGGVAVIKTVPKDGSGTPRTFAFDIGNASCLTADNTNIYWLRADGSGATVLRCTHDDCSGGPVVLVSPEPPSTPPWTNVASPYFEHLALSEGQFLWSTTAALPTSGSYTSNIRACSLAGCNTAAATIIQNQIGINAIAVDRTHVYWTGWTARTEGHYDPASSTVQRIRRHP